MSGGSWEYASHHLGDIVDALRNDTCTRHYRLDLNEHQKRTRRQLADLIEAVSHALHEIEWVDSSDTSYPADTDAIEKALFSRSDCHPLRHQRVDELALSVRLSNLLRDAHIKYIGDLVQKTESEMLELLGEGPLRDLQKILDEVGLSLGMKINWPSRAPADLAREILG